MRRDPVQVAMDHAEGPTRAWLAAVMSYAEHHHPTLAEVEALGILAQSVWDEVKRVALEQPDEGSGERHAPGVEPCGVCPRGINLRHHRGVA